MILDPTPKLLDMPAEEYHRDHSRVSHSMLEVFRESPRLYCGRFVTREYPSERTDAMDFGTATHAMLLEDRRVFVPIPRDALNADGHRKGSAWKQFAAENEGKILLTPDQQTTLECMVAELRRHKMAAKLLGCRGEREHTIHWTDEATGLDMKCRIDIVLEGMAIIGDYKTSADAAKFDTQLYDLGYHRQDALYRDAVKGVTGELPQFLFVVQQKSPPYTVRVVPLSPQLVTIGRMQNRQDIAALISCRGADCWDAPSHGRVETPIEPKPWMIKNVL